jgi:hypothetical protein
MAFTWQGIWQWPLGVSYPGWIEGEYWDKARIRKEMQAALDFQRRYNVPIYVGEFSVVRWAPLQSALQYLSDVIELSEEYKWSWTYWSFREWDGWSLEHIGPPDGAIFVGGESDRLQLIKRYFSQNQRWRGPLTGKGPLLPRILFDEYHAERNTISYQRAKILQLEHPEWYYYGDFMRRVESDYVLRRSVQPLTYDLLRNYDVLVLAAPNEALSQDEIQDILKFVKEGGGLLVLGDASLPLYINQLMTNFSMRFNNATISSKNPDWDAQSFWITDFNSSHVVTQGIKRFHTNWACSMEKGEQATALAYTGADTWRDRNSNGQQDIGEEVGPFVFILASEYGNGRIIAIADNAFQQGMLNVDDNGQLVLNALAWLSAPGGPYRH